MLQCLGAAAAGMVAITHAFAAGAQIFLFEHDNVNGRSDRTSYSVPNLNDGRFND